MRQILYYFFLLLLSSFLSCKPKDKNLEAKITHFNVNGTVEFEVINKNSKVILSTEHKNILDREMKNGFIKVSFKNNKYFYQKSDEEIELRVYEPSAGVPPYIHYAAHGLNKGSTPPITDFNLDGYTISNFEYWYTFSRKFLYSPSTNPPRNFETNTSVNLSRDTIYFHFSDTLVNNFTPDSLFIISSWSLNNSHSHIQY